MLQSGIGNSVWNDEEVAEVCDESILEQKESSLEFKLCNRTEFVIIFYETQQTGNHNCVGCLAAGFVDFLTASSNFVDAGFLQPSIRE